MDNRRRYSISDFNPEYSFPDELISIRTASVYECIDLYRSRNVKYNLVRDLQALETQKGCCFNPALPARINTLFIRKNTLIIQVSIL